MRLTGRKSLLNKKNLLFALQKGGFFIDAFVHRESNGLKYKKIILIAYIYFFNLYLLRITMLVSNQKNN